jgi:hypothetical protein
MENGEQPSVVLGYFSRRCNSIHFADDLAELGRCPYNMVSVDQDAQSVHALLICQSKYSSPETAKPANAAALNGLYTSKALPSVRVGNQPL